MRELYFFGTEVVYLVFVDSALASENTQKRDDTFCTIRWRGIEPCFPFVCTAALGSLNTRAALRASPTVLHNWFDK